MKVKRRQTGTASSTPAGLLWGGLSSVGTTLIGAVIAAKMIEKGIMDWNNAGYAVLVILVLSSWIGAMVTAGKIKRRRLVMCLSSGMIYFLSLLVSTALFFGGQYHGVAETALLVLCGSLLGNFMVFRGKRGMNTWKRSIRNC